MDENGKIRVLIVDDHPLLRQGLTWMFRKQPDIDVVGEGCDGFDAIEKARVLSPDVIIMDIGLPNQNGVDAIEEIIKEKPLARILVFSGTDDQEIILNAIRAGAIGVLVKTASEVSILKAVRETYYGMTTLQADTLHMLLSNPIKSQGNNPFHTSLSKREVEICELIANGMATKAIAKKLFLSESTIRSHINHILVKLNLKTRSDLIWFIHKEKTPELVEIL